MRASEAAGPACALVPFTRTPTSLVACAAVRAQGSTLAGGVGACHLHTRPTAHSFRAEISKPASRSRVTRTSPSAVAGVRTPAESGSASPPRTRLSADSPSHRGDARRIRAEPRPRRRCTAGFGRRPHPRDGTRRRPGDTAARRGASRSLRENCERLGACEDDTRPPLPAVSNLVRGRPRTRREMWEFE